MNNFRWITHLDPFAVIAQFHRLVAGDPWAGKTALARMVEETMPHRTLLLRCQNSPSVANFFDDLPMHDQPEFEKWKSLQRLLVRARKAIFADPVMAPLIDPAAPLGRVVISVLKPESVMAWHSDIGEYARRHVRFHLPLQTNPACTLYCGADSLHVPVGALIHLNALQQHSAGNWGVSLRSHVIFELRRRDAPEEPE